MLVNFRLDDRGEYLWIVINNRVISSGGSKGIYGPKISQFHAVFWKIWQIVCWRPLQGWRPLLRGILDPPLISLRDTTRISRGKGASTPMDQIVLDFMGFSEYKENIVLPPLANGNLVSAPRMCISMNVFIFELIYLLQSTYQTCLH